MPVSLIPGTGATVNAGGGNANPMQDFVQQLQQANELKKRAAMTDLDSAMKLAEFDPEAAMKLGKPALDTLHKQATGKGGSNSDNLFMEIHKRSQDKLKTEQDQAAADLARTKAATEASTASTAAANAQTEAAKYDTAKKEHIDQARKIYTDETQTPELRSQALANLHMLGAVSDEEFHQQDVFQHMTPDQKSHYYANMQAHMAGDMTEQETNAAVAKLAPELADKNYGGDIEKGAQAAKAILRGETPPPADLTDKQIDRAAKIGSYGVQMGWPQRLISQAQHLGTTDLDELGKKLGWSAAQRKSVDKMIPLEQRRVTAEEQTAAASNAQRYGAAFKDYMEGLKAEDVNKRQNMESLGKLVGQYRDLAMTKAPSDPSLIAIQKELTKQLGGTLGLVPGEVPGFLSTFTDYFAKPGLVPANRTDPAAIQGQGGPVSNPVGMPTTGVSSFTQPEVISRLPEEMMTTGLTAVGAPLKSLATGIGEAPGELMDYLQKLSASETERQKRESQKK
jgi:hypothetical protein